MREIDNLKDARVIVKELSQWKDRISSKNQDLKGLKIQNAGDATDPGDYVTLRQLSSLLPTITTPNQHFSIPFSSVGVVSVGQISAPFIVGSDRVGNPSAISVAVPTMAQAPTGGPLTINLTLNGIDMLAVPLVLNTGTEGPIFSSQFISPLPKLAVGYKIVPKIIAAGGASFVTIQLYVTRILT